MKFSYVYIPQSHTRTSRYYVGAVFVRSAVRGIPNVKFICPNTPMPFGNSPQMIFQHYRELVTEKGAKAWFAITPESTKAMREKAEQERQAKIVAHPALAAA